MSNGCRHLSRKIGPEHPLAGKTVYTPSRIPEIPRTS